MRMIQTSTTQLNDVVKYLYGETTNTENLELENDLCKDGDLLDFYLDSLALKASMDKITMSPSRRVIESIKAFSENYQPAI
ncbi:hypothetical protein SAMN06298216_1438 [Spirosomataceae bacterium TFI 002]|nr:hypothetical protein SAMN06298216_1438 [Spirosomataceae bacterium TFI 002]